MRRLRAWFVTLPVLGLPLLAQGPSAPGAVYMSAAEVSKGLRRRTGASEPQYAIIHPFSTEVYYIIEGAGSLVTGGTLDPPAPPPADPDIVRSRTIKNGVTRTVGKGDVIVVPPGTPHWFNAIDGTITYLESRVRVK